MSWMEKRVPGWQPTSEVDLSQVLLSLFSAAADELSDYQDRVMNEAYLATCRSRVSLARHARLMDYHVEQGNQASTWVALRLLSDRTIDPSVNPTVPDIEVRSGGAGPDVDAAVFRGPIENKLHYLVNALSLYTWDGAKPGLAAGSCAAELEMPSKAASEAVRDLIRSGDVPRLLIQEHRDPLTGHEAGADPEKRQILTLLSDEARADKDPLTGKWYVHVKWRREDQLHFAYCFSVEKKFESKAISYSDVSLFHGNLVRVFNGIEAKVVFKDPEARLQSRSDETQRHYEHTEKGKDHRPRWGTLCRLPGDRQLLYQAPSRRTNPWPTSTLSVAVDGVRWDERIDLVHSKHTDRHFVVETDEKGRSVLRFGNGRNGENLKPPSGSEPGSEVHCHYQTGSPLDGNVGANQLSHTKYPGVESLWNPFDVIDGRAPEPRDEVVRNAPEAYRTLQLRAITLSDYVERAQEVAGVSRAAAQYAWTGSWRTVRVTIDPKGGDVLRPELRRAVARHLEPVRLIGEDLEIRGPAFVPATVEVSLCVQPDVWPEDVRGLLYEEFSDGYTFDGRRGFFHADEWTFGRALRRSQILGRLDQVGGIEHVISVTMRRFDAPTAGTTDRIDVGPSEIIRVSNDPDHMELGSIDFDLQGGRR
jgi:hypothetical protein